MLLQDPAGIVQCALYEPWCWCLCRRREAAARYVPQWAMGPDGDHLYPLAATKNTFCYLGLGSMLA